MTRWSLFLQTLSLLHHFLGLYSDVGAAVEGFAPSQQLTSPFSGWMWIIVGGGMGFGILALATVIFRESQETSSHFLKGLDSFCLHPVNEAPSM